MLHDHDIIDQIYECSLITELWPKLLGKLAQVAGARTGFLFISSGEVHNWTASREGLSDVVSPLVRSGWIANSERVRRLLAMQQPGFLREKDIYADEELKDDPSYRDFLYPRGLGWAAATAVPIPTGDHFFISLEREYRLGQVAQSAIHMLNTLRPHLARSALLSARLHLERARVASQTLAMIGLPALVLNERGKILAANQLTEAMDRYLQWRAHDVLSLKDRNADKLLRAAIASSFVDNEMGVRSFPAHDVQSNEVVIIHYMPVRGLARDIFALSAGLVVLTPATRPDAPDVELIRSLFDLTPAEARVARSLASGSTVEEIASAGSISPNTVRTHVRGVLMKTGCNRQTDVVALLSGIWSPQAPA